MANRSMARNGNPIQGADLSPVIADLIRVLNLQRQTIGRLFRRYPLHQLHIDVDILTGLNQPEAH